jgi:hypothetical protein
MEVDDKPAFFSYIEDESNNPKFIIIGKKKIYIIEQDLSGVEELDSD